MFGGDDEVTQRHHGEGFGQLLAHGCRHEQDQPLAKGPRRERIEADQRHQDGGDDRIDDDRRHGGEHPRCQHPFSIPARSVNPEVPTGDGPPCKDGGGKPDEPRWKHHGQRQHQRQCIGPVDRERQQAHRRDANAEDEEHPEVERSWHLQGSGRPEKVVLDPGWLGGFDHHAAGERMHVGSLVGRVSLHGVGEFWPSEVEEQQEERREANSSEEGEERVERPHGSVHVPVDVTRDDEHGDLGNEEADDDQAEHGPNGLPGRGGSPHREAVGNRGQRHLLKRDGGHRLHAFTKRVPAQFAHQSSLKNSIRQRPSSLQVPTTTRSSFINGLKG